METPSPDPEKVVYSICIEDLQTIAMEDLNRELTSSEIDGVVDQLGDYIKWADAISMAIIDCALEPGPPVEDDPEEQSP